MIGFQALTARGLKHNDSTLAPAGTEPITAMSRRVGGVDIAWARLQLALVGFALMAGALAAPSAASAATPPQSGLTQAQSQLQALIAAADPAAQADLTDAVSQLGASTASYLWSDANDALAPPTGDRVFVDAAAALNELAKIGPDPTVPRSGLASAVQEIAGAASDLSEAALERAGLHHGFVRDRSLRADQVRYDHAFAALGTEISGALTSLPRQTVERSAENFLSSPDRFASRPETLSGAPLTLEGKPELFYYGAEFCPFCAVTRWSMVLALAQFGELSPLALSQSTPIDFAPSTNTLSFYGSQYESPELAFAPIEASSNALCLTECNGSKWTTLQTPNEAEQQILDQNDPQLRFPFLDFGNLWQEGAVVEPLLLQGMSWEQIAAAVANPGSTVGQYLDGAAELFAAQICQSTGERPQRVCSSNINRQYQQLLTAPSAAIDATNNLFGVSCPSTSLCAAVDGVGNALITQDPTASTPVWTAANADGTTAVTSVACPSTSLCVAVDAAGNALVTHDANTVPATWSAPMNIDGTNSFDYVRCPSTSLCVAVDDAGNVLETDDPSAATPNWSAPMNIDGTNPLVFSCPSTSLCVAADTVGNVLTSEDPSAAQPMWSTPQSIDPQSGFADVSCPSTSLCVAVDFSGNAFVSHDPGAATPTWGGPTDIDGNNALFAVSCASTSLCIAVGEAGTAVISDDPSATSPTWTATSIDDVALDDVSCPSASLCVAVDGDGDALQTDNPTAATPTWGPPAKFLH